MNDELPIDDFTTLTWDTSIWDWLTGERLLYGTLALFGLVIRLVGLGYFPLRAEEATNALAAWRILQPVGWQPAAYSPLIVNAGMVFFWIIRASDFTARLLPALAGASLVLLPSLWRKELGRIGALAVAGLLALSPSFLTFSRSADGALLASALCAWAGTLLYRAVISGEPKRMSLGMVALGLALTAAPNSYTWVITTLGLGATYYLLCKTEKRKALRAGLSLYLNRRALLCLGATWVLSATAAFVNLQGAGQALALPWRWLRSIAVVFPPFGWYGLARNLLVYEPLVLALAIYGVVITLRRGNGVTPWILGWFGCSLVLTWLTSAGQTSWIVDPLWPLLWLAGWGVQALWETISPHARTIDLVVVTPLAALLGFYLIELAAYGRVPDNRHLIYAAVGLALALIAWFGYWLWSDRRSAMRVCAYIVLSILVMYTIRSSSSLLYQTGADAREGFFPKPTSIASRELEAFISATSSHQAKDAHVLSISYPASQEPLLGWSLRDYPNSGILTDSRNLTTTAVILPLVSEEDWPRGYIGQRFTLYERFTQPNLPLHDLVRWFLMREPVGLIEREQVEFWLRPPSAKIYP
ncbi:MAG: hypothetical protein ACYCZF_04195 [Anaerolineae bacterium]